MADSLTKLSQSGRRSDIFPKGYLLKSESSAAIITIFPLFANFSLEDTNFC